jgi:hypothetical protein
MPIKGRARKRSIPSRLLGGDPINFVDFADPSGLNVERFRPYCATGENVWFRYQNVSGAWIEVAYPYIRLGHGGGVGTERKRWDTDFAHEGIVIIDPEYKEEIVSSVEVRFQGVGFVTAYGCGTPEW